MKRPWQRLAKIAEKLSIVSLEDAGIDDCPSSDDQRSSSTLTRLHLRDFNMEEFSHAPSFRFNCHQHLLHPHLSSFSPSLSSYFSPVTYSTRAVRETRTCILAERALRSEFIQFFMNTGEQNLLKSQKINT